jgi:two-component system chemotaxis response regulator CheY
MTPLNVMIVDDSLLATRKMEAMLEAMGHHIVGTVATGTAALQAYRNFNPDLVTMDITMPDMDGIEATRTILAEFKDANIVMVTSHGQEEMVREALKAGAKGYVLKPVNAAKLADHISRVIG